MVGTMAMGAKAGGMGMERKWVISPRMEEKRGAGKGKVRKKALSMGSPMVWLGRTYL